MSVVENLALSAFENCFPASATERVSICEPNHVSWVAVALEASVTTRVVETKNELAPSFRLRARRDRDPDANQQDDPKNQPPESFHRV